MAKVYKAEGIIIDRRKLKGRIKAAYYCDNGECSVLVNNSLPREPKLFAMAHELKHHYLDQQQILNGQIECGDYNKNELIEKGGEIFAAEFIYPELEMWQLLGRLDITSDNCTAETVVRLKRSCNACVSYTFLVKRLTRFRLCEVTTFDNVQFLKLEEKMFGLPIYKRPSFKLARQRKASRSS
jgi:Zn-dependent peptidase ImmA (M78 family)